MNSIESGYMIKSVGDILRFWRKYHRISQLDLALEVGISSKHLSFVETSKSKPSRKLVLRLGQSLQLPPRHLNLLLATAGYSPEFSEEPIDGEKMEKVREALQRILENHEPYPALAVNSTYKILMTNAGFDRMIKLLVGEVVFKKYDNVYNLTFAEDGLYQFIKNWPQVKKFMINRLWDEAVATQNDELFSLHEDITQLQPAEEPTRYQVDDRLPMMSMIFAKDALQASFFTMITTLGTPLDITTREIRIESLFPADTETKKLFNN